MKRIRRLIDIRTAVGVIGFVCAVLSHELLHIALHWGEVTHLSFFTSIYTIAEVGAQISPEHDVVGEEIAAYLITLLVLLVTAIIISRLHDHRDPRSFSETLTGKSGTLSQMSPAELLELAHRSNLLGTKSQL